jgi:hypothetical protein
MVTARSPSAICVLDRDEALDFSTGKLGFEGGFQRLPDVIRVVGRLVCGRT